MEIENKLNNHNQDKYITTSEFNTLAADVLMRDYHGEIITSDKNRFYAKFSSFNRNITENKKNIYLFKMS